MRITNLLLLTIVARRFLDGLAHMNLVLMLPLPRKLSKDLCWLIQQSKGPRFGIKLAAP